MLLTGSIIFYLWMPHNFRPGFGKYGNGAVTTLRWWRKGRVPAQLQSPAWSTAEVAQRWGHGPKAASGHTPLL